MQAALIAIAIGRKGLEKTAAAMQGLAQDLLLHDRLCGGSLPVSLLCLTHTCHST